MSQVAVASGVDGMSRLASCSSSNFVGCSRRFSLIVAKGCHQTWPTVPSTAVGISRAFATLRITSHSDLISSCHRAWWRGSIHRRI